MKRLVIFLLLTTVTMSAFSQWRCCEKCALLETDKVACTVSGESHVLLADMNENGFPSFIIYDESIATDDMDGAMYIVMSMNVNSREYVFEGISYYDFDKCMLWTDIFYDGSKMWDYFVRAKKITVSVYNSNDDVTVIDIDNRNAKKALEFISK